MKRYRHMSKKKKVVKFKETETQAEQLPHLPEEIIEDILKRLPVDSLVRFSCTCKRWCSLIFSDSKFNKAHIDHAKRPSWKLAEIYRKDNFITHHFIRGTVDCDFNYIATPHKETVISYLRYLAVLGSCNGLLFVEGYGGISRSKKEHVLWNPYTNSIKRIDGEFRDVSMSGLSYDRASDDYKAIVVLNDLGKGSSYVFSLRKNSWKKLSDLTFDFARTETRINDVYGVTLDNGICHWLIELEHESFSIICFDPVVEKFKEFPLPDNLRSSTSGLLGSLDGCLSLIHNNTVWVMKDSQSWTKLYVLKSSYCYLIPRKLVGYNSTKDKVVIACGFGSILICFLTGDVINGVVRNLTDKNPDIFVSTYKNLPYTESLHCPWLCM